MIESGGSVTGRHGEGEQAVHSDRRQWAVTESRRAVIENGEQ